MWNVTPDTLLGIKEGPRLSVWDGKMTWSPVFSHSHITGPPALSFSGRCHGGGGDRLESEFLYLLEDLIYVPLWIVSWLAHLVH